jgi:hypothetical protein
MYWIDKLLPACCKTRGSSEKQRKKPDLPDLSITFKNEACLNLQEEDRKELKLGKISESRRSTNFTADTFKDLQSNDRHVLLTCEKCGLEATGYCPSCPHKRFCSECFEIMHKNLSGLHKFIEYKTSRSASKQDLKNLIKIKKFM